MALSIAAILVLAAVALAVGGGVFGIKLRQFGGDQVCPQQRVGGVHPGVRIGGAGFVAVIAEG
jgi:hypothetical protein